MTEEKSDALKENSSDLQENFSSLPVGEILRRTRLQHGLSEAQVQAALRIKATYLDALEKSDFERLPGQVYVIGYVKSYAEYLGLDSDKIIQLLKKQAGTKVARPAIVFPVVSDEQKIPSLKIIITSTAVLILILLAWKVTDTVGNRSDEIPALPNDLKQQMTAPQKPPEETKPVQTVVEAAKPKPHPVVLKATQDVWLEIRDEKSQPIFSRVLKEGEEYWVPPDVPGYTMTTGNAGGLQPIVEGQMLPHLGKPGEVKRKISLNPWDLKGEPAPVTPPEPQAGTETPVTTAPIAPAGPEPVFQQSPTAPETGPAATSPPQTTKTPE